MIYYMLIPLSIFVIVFLIIQIVGQPVIGTRLSWTKIRSFRWKEIHQPRKCKSAGDRRTIVEVVRTR